MLCGSPCQQKVWQGLSSPYGFPWLTQQGKRAAVAVTVNAAILFVLAFEAMTQKGTGMVLTTSEERGEAQRGEPRSWWQAAETKHLATMGATRSAYTCGLAQRWRQGRTTSPGPMGIMTNFPCSNPTACCQDGPGSTAQRKNTQDHCRNNATVATITKQKHESQQRRQQHMQRHVQKYCWHCHDFQKDMGNWPSSRGWRRSSTPTSASSTGKCHLRTSRRLIGCNETAVAPDPRRGLAAARL